MTTPSPEPISAYIDAGVIGYVFGEMWRRGVLTPRDRRWITLSCLGAVDSAFPIETHVYAALNSGDISGEEFDEFVLFFATQLGWPKASVLTTSGMTSSMKIAEQSGRQLAPLEFVPWTDPVSPEERHGRGDAAYEEIQGVAPPPPITAFRRDAQLDYLYGEIWARDASLTRRDRRVVSICCSAAVGADSSTREQLTAALANEELTYEELQEVVVHFAVYVGWILGRKLDDILIEVATQLDAV
ncbi:MAG TPA: carboxymuconolactone decarboxylase family protein [Acidimicrobiales bacterium]|nr:carboxymuconolactone decarboxylase family protein [Acidimicrobiales bacterium]